jgi:hypothetical protein
VPACFFNSRTVFHPFPFGEGKEWKGLRRGKPHTPFLSQRERVMSSTCDPIDHRTKHAVLMKFSTLNQCQDSYCATI